MTRLQTYLTEKWVTYGGKKFELLENPTTREITKMVGATGEVRWLAVNDTEKMWVWDANEMIHFDVWKKIGNISWDDALELPPAFFSGYANLKSGKWTLTESHQIRNLNMLRNLQEQYKWVEKYISIKGFRV